MTHALWNEPERTVKAVVSVILSGDPIPRAVREAALSLFEKRGDAPVRDFITVYNRVNTPTEDGEVE